MTDLKQPEVNAFAWTPQAYAEAKAEAAGMTIERLTGFIAKCMRRSSSTHQVIGSAVLACIAAYNASLRLVKNRPHPIHLSMAALLTYKEMANVIGPLRVIDYERMLMPGQADHFKARLDWQAAQWLVQEANARLLTPGLDPQMKAWLTKIALGHVPYGWTAERPPIVADGFYPIGHRR